MFVVVFRYRHSEHQSFLNVANYVKEIDPDLPIIAGGVHITNAVSEGVNRNEDRFFNEAESIDLFFVREAEQNIIKTNEEFHVVIENRKKTAEDKIKQMKLQAIRDIKNSAVEIAVNSVEKIIKNSIDKKKLDKIYISSVDEAKKILKNKSI